MRDYYTITELTREFGISTRTIRFYEDQGLLEPERRGQHRIFRQRDRVRLKLILRGKRMGFKLHEIREIIDMYDAPSGEEGQLKYFLGKIEARRRELEEKRRDIEETLAEIEDVEDQVLSRLGQLS